MINYHTNYEPVRAFVPLNGDKRSHHFAPNFVRRVERCNNDSFPLNGKSFCCLTISMGPTDS